jgi:hypothetical protein
MYEIKSCGVTLDFTRDAASAHQTFNNSWGAHVILYRFNDRGQKAVIAEKHNYAKGVPAGQKQFSPQ